MNAARGFSMGAIAPHLRAAKWRSAIAETYFPLELEFRDRGSFDGRLKARRFGALGLSRLTSDPVRYERRAEHLRREDEASYLVTIPRLSPVEFRQFDRDVTCDPGAILLERGDAPYRFAYGRANDLHVLKVPRRALTDRMRAPDEACARAIDARSGAAGLFVAAVEGALHYGEDASSEAISVTERHLLDLLALALGEATRADAPLSAVRAAHRRRAERFILDNLSDPDLGPETVAAACGISKRYLHEIFRDANETVSQRVRDQRLDAAERMLLERRELTIAQIAYRFGFSDHGQFSRLFKARFHLSPRDRRNGSAA